MPALTLIPVTDALADLAAALAADLRLKGADALYVAVALQRGISLTTWDEEQRIRGAQVIVTKLPDVP